MYLLLFLKFILCLSITSCSSVNNDASVEVSLQNNLRILLNNLDEVENWKMNRFYTAEVLFTSKFGDCSEELTYIMDVSCFSSDPLNVFQALKTDLIMEKKQFRLLERPLIQLLVGWYDGFG